MLEMGTPATSILRLTLKQLQAHPLLITALASAMVTLAYVVCCMMSYSIISSLEVGRLQTIDTCRYMWLSLVQYVNILVSKFYGMTGTQSDYPKVKAPVLEYQKNLQHEILKGISLPH